MMQILELLVRSIEEHMKTMNRSLEMLQNLNYMFVIKLVDWKLDRYTVFEIIEEGTSYSEFLIRARNNFMSYSNYSESIVYDTASILIRSSQVKEVYGLEYPRLENSEKRMVWISYVKRATLETIEEGVALSSITGEQPMGAAEALFAKTLTMSKIDIPAFTRIHSGGEHKIPITISLVGYSGEIIGISLRLYSPNQVREEGGLFLVPSNTFELNIPKEKKKKQFGGSPAEYLQRFALVRLLKSKGFELLAKTVISRPKASLPLLRLPSFSLQSQLAPLENILDLSLLL
jgi:hypothetical protein